jgi:polar amino acid transport system permease protein
MDAAIHGLVGQIQIVTAHSHVIFLGTMLTLQLAALSILFGTVIGVSGGLALSHGPKPLRLFVRGYVEVVRGLPLLVIIFISYYWLPLTLGVDVDAFSSVVFALSMYAGAQISEIVRGAINSIHRNQSDAAKSIGLTFFSQMLYIILPQALRRALPPWVNVGVDVIRGTSLCALVSISDLLLSTNHLIETQESVIPFYLFAALIYFGLCFLLSRVAGYLELAPVWRS